MAKVAFTKLNLVKNINVVNIQINEQIIEVKQYLPITEKLELISNVLNQCQDDNNFINDAKMYLFMNLEIIYKYTNISFTDKQKEDPAKLYDLLAGNGVMNQIIAAIPQMEYDCISTWLRGIAEHIYSYRNSVYGILDAMSKDYSNLELDASKIAEDIGNPESLSFLKEVLSKMG